MEDLIKQAAQRFGIDEAKAAEIVAQLQAQGHDIPSLLQSGDLLEKVKELIGERGHDLLAGVPAIGGMHTNLFPEGKED